MDLIPKRKKNKKNILINYIYTIKPHGKKIKRATETRVNFMEQKKYSEGKKVKGLMKITLKKE